MLKLKKLQLQGFKSFSDRAEVHFSGTGIAAIVGPNGCGKSNLADAIGWVLGEQSAKSLRGTRMEDVIFSGTRDRPATGFAEVSLTLLNPAEEQHAVAELPAPAAPEPELPPEEDWEALASDADEAASGAGVVLSIRKRRVPEPERRPGEITVTRRLYRAGNSEYLMNGRACRLRDIQELFLGTGLGPECYAIISQGRIDQILSSKPYDRRAVIEEAAGVSKYKVRRRLAEARLEQARQNLGRINDIFEEVTRQASSLKRQAARAERYQALKTEYDGKQRACLRARAEGCQAQWRSVQAEMEDARAAAAALEAELGAIEERRAAETHRGLQLESELRQASEAGARCTRDLDRLAQQIVFLERQTEELAARAEGLERETAGVAEEHRRLGSEWETAQAERDAAGAALAGAADDCARARDTHAAAQAEVAQTEDAVERARQEMLALLAHISTLTQRRAQRETLAEEIDRRRQRLAGEVTSAASESQGMSAQLAGLERERAEQAAQAQRLTERLAERESELAALHRGEAGSRAGLEAARARLAEVAARRRSLEELVAHHGYSNEAVRRLFQRGSATPRFAPMGLLGEYLDVDADYEPVIEEFLRDELDYVVVGTWDQAGAGVELLRDQGQGRATFLVEAPVSANGNGTAPAAGPPPEPGLVALASEVRLNNGFRGRLEGILPRLRDAYLVADRAQGQRLAGQYPAAWFLTRAGECFHACTVAAGTGAATGPLRVKRELAERMRQEQELAATLGEHEAELQRLTVAAGTTAAAVEKLRAELHEAEKSALTAEQAARQAEAESARLQARAEQLAAESERTRREWETTGHELAACAQAQAEAETALEQRRAAEAEARSAATAARTGSDAAAAALAARQQEQARHEERAAAAQSACRRLEQMVGGLAARLAEYGTAIAGTAQRRVELAAQRGDAEREQTAARAAAEAAAARQSELDTALTAARARATAAEAEASALRERLEAARRSANESAVAAARLETDLHHLDETCRQEIGCELAALLAEPAPASATPEARAALESEVQALRARIDSLGPINMVALEEYEETRERHRFLETQRNDLMQSITDTQRAIGEIDTVSRRQFDEAFARINAFFHETFRDLFGGGVGELRQSALEGQTEAGIDIVAQPPGKKLQNVLLLSGGERAMTAMALLLAIFRFQPSPFCLLDEGDAALDEANVTRFGAMLHTLAADTQFILITHNKRTMELASRLYGVTMPQQGVSRLVSVNLEEPARRAAG